MNINGLYNKFKMDEWLIYNNQILKPFIDAYFKNKNKYPFTLFYKYIFSYDRIKQYLTGFCNYNHIVMSFKNKKVQHYLDSYYEVYIGNVYYRKKLHPFFLYFSKYENRYDVTGFHIGFDYQIHEYKKFTKIKNLDFNIQPEMSFYGSSFDRIKELSESTKEYILK